jgi:probable HAF family extracellular repeat protein
MNPKNLTRIAVLTLLVAVTYSVRLAARSQVGEERQSQHHHYKLIDLGTLGGPQSYVNAGSGNETTNFASILSNRGTMTGAADTTVSDPFPGFCFNDDCFVSHAFQWKHGVETDLGALPGGGSSASDWVSGNGLIAGLSENGELDPLIPGLPEVRAVLWRNGAITNLGTLPEGGFESIANAVNGDGQVVGLALNTTPDPDSMIGAGFQTRAFLWRDGAMQDLGTLGAGTDAQAILINEKGQVVGWSYINSTPTTACNAGSLVIDSFIWDQEHRMRDLGSLGGTCTLAADMNNDGQVVGFSDLPGDQSSHAFIWKHGSFHDLGGTLGGDFQAAFAINDTGTAVGFGFLPGNVIGHATLWNRPGEMLDLGGVGNDQCSFATSINAEKQVVGSSGDCVLTARVFLWERGSMADLNALIPAGSTLSLQLTETINDRGEIAGIGVDADGYQHAFLAIPCDSHHPNVEGCDYTLVDGDSLESTSAPAPAVTAHPRTTASAALPGFTGRWKRSFGVRAMPWSQRLAHQVQK